MSKVLLRWIWYLCFPSDAYVVVWDIMQTLVKLGLEIEILLDEIVSCQV